jgi:CrcB protein
VAGFFIPSSFALEFWNEEGLGDQREVYQIGSAAMNGAYLWLIAGRAAGTIARFWLAAAVAAFTGPTFPWGTSPFTIASSFVIGLVAGPNGPLRAPFDILTFLMVGIYGGFATFSSFSLQTLHLVRSDDHLSANAYVLLWVILCLFFVWCHAMTCGPPGSRALWALIGRVDHRFACNVQFQPCRGSSISQVREHGERFCARYQRRRDGGC